MSKKKPLLFKKVRRFSFFLFFNKLIRKHGCLLYLRLLRIGVRGRFTEEQHCMQGGMNKSSEIVDEAAL